MNRLLIAKEAAPILNVSVSRLYALVRRGLIPPGVVIKLSQRQLRFSEEGLRSFMNAGGLLAGENVSGSTAKSH